MKTNRQELLNSLPPELSESLLPDIREQVAKSGQKIVVLDDDPTGTQTVQNISVLTIWTVEALERVLREPEPVVYILTNSRSFPLSQAQAINREIAANLKWASQTIGRDFVVISRSDSTLRGHFPGEVLALAEELQTVQDGILVAPFFLEGGRYTIDDIHYVAEGETLVPAAETEYARDAAFGYHSSNLKEWVMEKYQALGQPLQPEQVCSISIQGMRTQGPKAVTRQLSQISSGQVCIVNAASYQDLEIFVLGLLAAEAAGKRFIYRTAASFVRVRAGMEPQDPFITGLKISTDRSQNQVPGHQSLVPNPYSPGIIIAGSYIRKSSAQIEALLALPNLAALEVQVESVLDDARREAEVKCIARLADQAMVTGKDILIYTSRRLVTGADETESLRIGQAVSAALVAILSGIQSRPGWVIAKGGITSSDIATRALNVQQARVLGQAIPGVPVWQTGAESRWPGLIYVVFPGNVGGDESIVEVVKYFRRG